MPLYDFRCKQGHVTEVGRGVDCQEILCPACGATAKRVAVYRDQTIICETGPKSRR